MLHQLGAGTLGPVFRAHDPAEGRLVAIKAFRLDLPPQRAVQLAAALDQLVGNGLTHPTIAAPLAAGLESSTPWFAQAYVAAEALDGALRQFGPAPISHVVTTVTHLAGALDFGAAAGVFHGSLHPRDVLVAPGETFVVDMGVAGALEQCGIRPPIRRPYTAPERVEGAPVSRPADVFALAAVAFELLTGHPIAGAGREAAERLPDIQGADMAGLQAAFADALAVEAGSRPPSALAFASALKAALGAAAFRTAPAVAPRRTQRLAPMLPLGEAEAVAPSAEARTPSADVPAADVPPPMDTIGTPVSAIDMPAPEVEAPVVLPAPGADDTGDPEPDPMISGTEVGDEADIPMQPLDDLPPVRPRFADFEDDEPHAAPARAPLSRADRPGAALTPRPARRPAARSIALVVLAVVLAAAVGGFGIGWIWSKWSGSSETQAESSAPVDRADAPPAEPAPLGSGAPAGATPSGVEASSGVDPAVVVPDPAPPVEPRPAVAAPPKPKPAAPARLLVRSSPAGAAVQINGRSRGTTPLTVRDLPLGSHTVVLSRPGYTTERRTIRLTRTRASQSLEVSLREAAPAGAARRPLFTGSVMVDSRPRDARVMLNGEEVGRTPMLLPEVRAGSHVVRLEMDGYRTWTASVRVVAGERNRVTASLEEMP